MEGDTHITGVPATSVQPLDLENEDENLFDVR